MMVRFPRAFKKIAAMLLTVAIAMSALGCGDLIYILDDSAGQEYEDYDDAYQSGYEAGYEDGYNTGRTDERDLWADSSEYWDDDPYNGWDEDDWYDDSEFYADGQEEYPSKEDSEDEYDEYSMLMLSKAYLESGNTKRAKKVAKRCRTLFR